MLIIATINPKVSEEQIKKIILSGADVLRFNLSRYSLKENLDYIDTTRSIIDDLNASVKELLDFPLNKIRIGEFDLGSFAVRENEELIFQSAPFSPDCNQFIPVNISKLGKKIWVNEIISLGNGQVSIQVEEIMNLDTIKARILNNGIIKNMQTFNNGDALPEEDVIKTYTTVLDSIISLKPAFIALSYIDSSFIEKIKHIISLQQINIDTKIVGKIENEFSEPELEKILQDPFFDAILVDRGELGINMPFEKIGVYEKKILAHGKKLQKKMLVSTQILASTRDSYIPARPEINDLTNIILDGASGIILCHEMETGKRPAYTISIAKKIIKAVENNKYLYPKK